MKQDTFGLLGILSERTLDTDDKLRAWYIELSHTYFIQCVKRLPTAGSISGTQLSRFCIASPAIQL